MNDFASLMPRSEQVLVGDKTLLVPEYTGAKRDAIIAVLLSGLEIVALAEPIAEAVKTAKAKSAISKKEEDIELNFADLAVKLEGSVKNILSRDLSQVMCITLDTEENRTKVGIKSGTSTENKTHHFKFNQDMFDWVKNNLTMRQEPNVLGAILEVNDFASLIKKYLTLISKATPKEMGETKSQ